MPSLARRAFTALNSDCSHPAVSAGAGGVGVGVGVGVGAGVGVGVGVGVGRAVMLTDAVRVTLPAALVAVSV